MDSNMIREKQSLNISIKERDSEGSSSTDFHTSKSWFDNFKTRLNLCIVKIMGEAAFSSQEDKEIC